MREDLIFESKTLASASKLEDGNAEQRERVFEALLGLREQAAVAEQIALARERVARTDRDADARLALLALAVEGFVEEHERVLADAGREQQHLAELGKPPGGVPRVADPAGSRRLAPRRACCRVRSAWCRPARRDQ